jgi:transcriptional regulator with XRE-family HTH domain
LRKAQQMTQLQIAEILGVHQGEVSKIEHRSDICVSTLAEFVEAMVWGPARNPRGLQRSRGANHAV